MLWVFEDDLLRVIMGSSDFGDVDDAGDNDDVAGDEDDEDDEVVGVKLACRVGDKWFDLSNFVDDMI